MTLASMKLLIANRGEIACRIARTAKRLGIKTVAVYSDADRGATHTRVCDEAVHIGPSPATDSYLRIDKIIDAAKATGATAIHPGYGFLSENADLPDACAKAGLTFVGPSGKAMRALGGKAAAKEIAIKAGVPVVPGYQGAEQAPTLLAKEAAKIGYPVMIKAVAGGGGRGMRLVERDQDFAEALSSAQREAASAFGNATVLIEKFVRAPRHIEVQVFGDQHGNAVHMFERDCSLQRRNQKVIEEAPAPDMSPDLRAAITTAAVKLAKSVGYAGAGTVEFLIEGGKLTANAPWYFIEMNTRLQVEHPVTEEITGLDLVEWQLRIAAGEKLPKAQEDIRQCGHAIELRLCAEDPSRGFLPSIGRLDVVAFPAGQNGLRIETGVEDGSSVSPFYDSMIAKLITTAPSRALAITAARRVLDEMTILGVETNAAFLANLLDHADTRAGTMDTGLIGRDLDRLVAHDDETQGKADVAQAFFALQSHPYGANGPWGATDGFVLGAPTPIPVRLDINGAIQEFEVQHGAGAPSVRQGSASANWSGPVGVSSSRRDSQDPSRILATRKRAHYAVRWPHYDPSIADDGDGSGTVRAPINGRVAKVFVQQGAVVAKGDRIAIVEAMKMEHSLVATTDGKLEKLNVVEGQQVSQGAVIATIGAAAA